jgi:hypothetical protein
MKTKIYVLLDKDGVIRYVGKTIRSLERRLSGHIYEVRRREQCHRANWIRKCLSEGYRPTIQLLEEVEGDGNAEEIYWIKFFWDAGLGLVNGTDGGDGILNPSPETIAKMSLAKIGKKLSPEHRAKLSLARMGHKVSLETRAKLSLAQKGKACPSRKHSLEASARASVALMGNKNNSGCKNFLGHHHSAETKAKISLTKRKKNHGEDIQSQTN